MTRIRIIGVGSPAGDDQIGWRVIDALGESEALRKAAGQIRLLALDRPGVQLIQHMQGADIVVLIDALKSGSAPGTIYRVDDVAQLEKDWLVSSHGFGVAAALELADALGVLPKRLLMYGIELGGARFGVEPDAAVSAAIGEVAARVCRDIAAASDAA